MKKEKGVIWVSTILYILISLAVLSLVLVSVQPIIDKNRDKAICLQSEQLLKAIDAKILETSGVQGNKLSLELTISRGNLIINSSNDRIIWELQDSAYQYSEQGKDISVGDKLRALTTKNQGKWDVRIYLDYNNKYDITYAGQETNKILTESEYNLFFQLVNSSSRQIDITS
jgi:hypothetical protein